MMLLWSLRFFFLVEYAPRLFLHEGFEKIRNLILLDPAWLMTAMRGVMELETESDVACREQRIALVKDGIADFRLLCDCWEKNPVKLSPNILCLICQAYCLICPVPREDKPPKEDEKEDENKEFIVPCKLPRNNNIDRSFLEFHFGTFFFDFSDFLPDEIYYRLICLALKDCKTKYTLSKRKCFFRNIDDASWLFELENSRVKINVQ
jgi:hypothetical protein